MRSLSFSIGSCLDGKNVRSALYQNGVSRRLLIRLKNTENGIMLNGRPARVIDSVQKGDIVAIQIPQDTKPALPQSVAVPVLYFDDDLIVLNKPPFMICHPSRNHQSGTLAHAFAAIIGQRGKAAAFRPLNRLDRDTSGVLIAALNSYAAAKLTGHIYKEYLAVCRGCLEGEGTIDLPISRVNDRSILREVSTTGSPAVTHWRALASCPQATLLRVWLETGRTHQIRVHFSYLGHSLIGDDFYGDPDPRIPRQALHCSMARFFHPVTGKTEEVVAPLPGDMRTLLSSLGLPTEEI